MRRIIIGSLLAFTFSAVDPAALIAAVKPIPPKIDIKKITLASETKGVVPTGTPLAISVEVNASQDVPQPLAVLLELKKGKDVRTFREGIERLSKGMNSFKWDLTGNPDEGRYSVSVEIACPELKLKDKMSKSFRVGEKKTAKAKTTTQTKTSETKTTQTKTKQTKTTKSGDEDGKKEEDDEGVSLGGGMLGGEEEFVDANVTVTGQSVRKITIAGITLNGNFVQSSPGVYLAQGEIKPDGFPISIGKAAGELTVDKNRDRIEGQMYISVIGFGKIGQISDLVLSKTQLKFKGKITEKITIPVVKAEISLAEAIADFEISAKRLACTATGGVTVAVSVPKVGQVRFEVASVGGGFSTSIPPEGITVSGSGAVTIPFEPPIKIDLSGSAEVTKKMISGTGAAALFEVLEVANGEFKLQYDGMMTIDANIGAFLKDYGLEASLADTEFKIDLPKKLMTGELEQSIKVLDLFTIPGSVKGKLAVDGAARTFSISGKAKVPLTGTAIAPDQLAVGIEDFLIKVRGYNSPTRSAEIAGDLALSVWKVAGFRGTIERDILAGRGMFYLPPGLKQLLDLEKIDLPVTVDLRSAAMMGELGGDIAGLAVKHFPLVGPQIIVKNDGVHLKGQIGIANVITIPLGDLVFTKTNSYTTIDGDIGIGPFTVAEGNFTLPAKASDGIGFSGRMGIPGLSSQRLTGTVYRDGAVDLSGMTRLGIITVDALSRFDVSKDGLHADRAEFGVDMGGAARCALTFTRLDIGRSAMSGRATGSFTGVLGIAAALRGDFLFDGEAVTLSYPDAVTLCGVSVRKAKIVITAEGVTGAGTISAAGHEKNITITVENGIMKLKGPAGELIAEGMRVADQLAGTAADIAAEGKEVVAEDAQGTLDNLSRMTDPWVKEALAAARAAKGVYEKIERAVVDEVTRQARAALDDLKKAADAAVRTAKAAIAAAVDAVCDAIIAVVDGVQAIFSRIEAKIPAEYASAYRAVKAKVIEKGNAVKARVVSFRQETKEALYDLTGTITALYQGAIDHVTAEANAIAGKIKQEMDPAIAEIDALLTEIGQEIDAATGAAGDEAERRYAAAKAKAGLLKKKADNVVTKYKGKAGELVRPYMKQVLETIDDRKAKVAKERDAVIDAAIKGLAKAKETLAPVIEPFEDAVTELHDLAGKIGGALYHAFLDGIGEAGDAMNAALGTAGKGLVKAADVVGDAAVAASGAAADASQAAYQAATATVSFVADTGVQAVNVAVDTAQEGYQTATEAAQEAATAAQQAASQAYQTATTVAAAAQNKAESTVTAAINALASIPPSSFATGSPVSFSDIQSGAQAVSAKVSAILDALDSYASSAYSAASSAASSVGSTVSSGASTVASGISTRWKKAVTSVSSLWGSSSATPPPAVSYAAPEVMNVAATTTTNSVTITYNTSFDSRTIIFYSATPTVNPTGKNATTSVASLHTGDYYPETTNHSITIANLSPGTAYYYLIYAVHMTTDGNATFATKKGPYMAVTRPSTAIIGGVVKDAAGAPIAAAKIHVGQAATPAATTDATGRFTLEVNPGAYTVTVKKDNYLSSAATTAALSAGQILPLDFTLADGRIFVSGIVKDAGTNAALGGANVTLSGPATPIGIQNGATGTFTIVLGTTASTGPVAFTLAASKAGYIAYTSSQITLSPGAKLQNVEIRLPPAPPAFTGGGASVSGITASQARVSFAASVNCAAFVQLGPQSASGYAFQTPSQANKNSFSFDLVGLNPATAYKYKAVLQGSSGTVAAVAEGSFTTAPAVSANTDIGLNATVGDISGTSAKLHITSAFKTLKHQLVLRDTTANTQLPSRDLGLLVSPVSVDLQNLVDGHSYTADLTSSLLANVTTGAVVKVASKSVAFQVPQLKSIVIRDFKVTPGNVRRGTATPISATATVRIHHAVTGATLKVTAGAKEICSQSLGNLPAGEMQISCPLTLSAIPGTGSVAVKMLIQAGAIQESSIDTLDIAPPATQGGNAGKPAAI